MTDTQHDEATPRTAIVTGADSGIGRATAVAFAAAGMDVGITYSTDQEGAEESASEVRAHGRRAEVAHLDVSDAPRCGDIIDELRDRLGGIDVFVSNAGVGASTPFLDHSWDEWRQVVATDLDGPFICLQRAARRASTASPPTRWRRARSPRP